MRPALLLLPVGAFRATTRALRPRAASFAVAAADGDLDMLRTYDRERGAQAADAGALAASVRSLAAAAPEVRLGVSAATQGDATRALGAWVSALELKKGALYGADVDGVPVDVPGPVFVKYDGATGAARLRHDDDDRTPAGVLFYPVLSEDSAKDQFLLPLDLFAASADLRGRERRVLRAAAARRGDALPTMRLKGPPSPAFLAECAEALEANELVKVKFVDAGKKKAARAAAEGTLAPALGAEGRRCHVASVVGHTALLYRASARSPTIDLAALVASDPGDLLK